MPFSVSCFSMTREKKAKMEQASSNYNLQSQLLTWVSLSYKQSMPSLLTTNHFMIHDSVSVLVQDYGRSCAQVFT